MRNLSSHKRTATVSGLWIGCVTVAMLGVLVSSQRLSSTSQRTASVSLLERNLTLELSPVPTSMAAAATTTVGSVPSTLASSVAQRQDSAMVAQGEGFWYRLASCESGNGRGSRNQYQFMGGTAAKVGIDGSEPVAEQTAAAQQWAALLRSQGISPGSTSGWPVCWWVAGGS